MTNRCLSLGFFIKLGTYIRYAKVKAPENKQYTKNKYKSGNQSVEFSSNTRTDELAGY